MVALAGHGGGCCGMRHIYGFDGSPESKTYVRNAIGVMARNGSTLLEKFDSLIHEIDSIVAAANRSRQSKTIEVILTRGQLAAYPGWLPVLKERGFKLVNRFTNTSGSICNVFHRTPSEVKEPLAGWEY
jgi:hypothetical protein